MITLFCSSDLPPPTINVPAIPTTTAFSPFYSCAQIHPNSTLWNRTPDVITQWIRLNDTSNGDYPASPTPRAITPTSSASGRTYGIISRPKGVCWSRMCKLPEAQSPCEEGQTETVRTAAQSRSYPTSTLPALGKGSGTYSSHTSNHKTSLNAVGDSPS